MYAAVRAARLHKTLFGLRLLQCFAPPHLGQGSLLRKALLPAPNVIYNQTLCEMWAKMLTKLKKPYIKIMAQMEEKYV